MLTRRILLAAALVCGLSGASMVLAADHPNLSGEWKLDAAKSDYGKMPPPSKLIRKIEHNDPMFKVTSIFGGPQGDVTTSYSYKLDGTEQDVKMGSREMKVTPAWKDDKVLVVTTVWQMRGTEVKSVELWMLSEDGKTLVTESKMTGPMGENKIHQVFEKEVEAK